MEEPGQADMLSEMAKAGPSAIEHTSKASGELSVRRSCLLSGWLHEQLRFDGGNQLQALEMWQVRAKDFQRLVACSTI